LEKFSDKYYTEEDDGGETWDLSQFKSDLPDDNTIKDYGDGSNEQEYYQDEVKENGDAKVNGETVIHA